MEEKMKKMLEDMLSEANTEDKYALSLLLSAVKSKISGNHDTFLSGLLHIDKNFLGNETLEMTIPNTLLIQNSLQIVHGGITATLLDSAMGTLVNQIIPDYLSSVTAEIKINYLLPGEGATLKCIASIIHHGTKTVVTKGDVYREDGSLMAHATATFFIVNKKM